MNKISGVIISIFLFFTLAVSAQNDKPKTENYYPEGYIPDTSANQTGSFVDNVVHVYNMDSIDKAKKVRDHAEFLRLSALEAETDKINMKKHIGALTMRNMRGRGYVKNGADSAAIYILKEFKRLKLKPVAPNGAFTQGFAFPVNTFPKKMKLSINGDSLKGGADFLIEPSSASFMGERLRVRKINMNDIADRAAWKIILSQLDLEHVYILDNVDLFCSNVLNVKRNIFLKLLPKGCFVIPQDGHLQWSVSRDTISATVFYVHNTALPKVPKTAEAAVTSVFIPKARTQNLVACVPGVVKDSFIVFTSHYDHLGMMGDTISFPGASDNASGVAMMLHLASYYAKHPPRYTMVFISFSGEEATLMGSEFFTKFPMIPLKKIKFLTNFDIMGDATSGITVVNASENPTQFGLLKQVNDKEKFLPEIRSKGPAANSDHYYFAQAGVPCFFIYSNGGKGYYHDIYDKAKEITAINLDKVARLMISFAKELE